jgi:hypothetical protein
MQSLAIIEHWEAEYVYKHMPVAHDLFRSSHRHQMGQVVFPAKVAPVVAEMHP